MNYDKPELVSLLASQYVLGTLRGPARRRFEQLRGTRPAVQEAVQFWEDLLQPLALRIDAVSPPPSLRALLLARAFASKPQPAAPVAIPATIEGAIPGAMPATVTSARRRRRDVLSRGLGFLAAASIAGVMLVLGAISLGGGRLSFPAKSPLAQAAERLEPMPMYLARLGIPMSSMGWMISLSPDHRTLQIVASDDFFAVGRGAVQLWWLQPDGPPRPLAILGTERDSTVTVAVPPGFASGRSLVFAISLEPSGGSPTGTPSGPILDRAEQADAI